MNEEVLDLLDRHRDGGLAPEEHARLLELLKSDPEARRSFVQEQMLQAAFHLQSPASMESAPIERAVPQKSRSWSGWHWAAAAAVVLSVFGIGWSLGDVWRKPPPLAGEQEAAEPVDHGIAVVTQTVDARWGGEAQPRTGSLLTAGKLQLVSGLAQIEFYSGVRLILDGPSDVELVSANQAICHAGRLRAQVPPQARGFSITAPKFKVVDLGTEFGLEVASTGSAKVQVFDGEVELHSQEPVRQLLGGKGLSWLASGEKSEIAADPASLPSFDQVRDLTQQHSQQRHAAWQKWNASLADDPRIAVRYDFESNGGALRDSGGGQAHGLIIGCERTNGRWAEKGALEFKRTSDRVRVDIPGEFDSLSMTAWIRLDALQERHQALLLTDGFEVGHPHWQIAPPGDLRLGIRSPSAGPERVTVNYGAPAVFGPGQLGVWSFVAVVYDRPAREVRHYINGRLASATAIRFDQPLRIGSAEIGNWGVAVKTDKRPVRNFIGRMDELTIWKAALSADEIREMHRQHQP
jgi:ferric-dicitrate binding protein FerR (iron transport regulator)